MVTSFLGQYTHSVDDKGRVALPARFRGGEAGPSFVATPGIGPCLFLYPSGEWSKVHERLERQKARVDPEQRRYYLQLMRYTAEVTLDGQGRISVPQHLVEAAGIEKEVLFVGAGDVVEMWDPDRYEGYVGESEADFEQWFSKFL